MELRLLPGIAKLRVEQALRELVEDGGLAHPLQVLQAHIGRLADDAGVLRDRGADKIGGELEDRVGGERCLQVVLGQLHPVALDPGKTDL